MANLRINIYDVDTISELIAAVQEVMNGLNSNPNVGLPHGPFGFIFKDDDGKIVALINEDG